MVLFTGRKNEFKRFLGPYIRVNLVTQIAKSYKAKIGQCQHCGSKENLESAHIHGRSRAKIIDLILADYSNTDVINVDLKAFETKFKKAHHPLKDNILILCSRCHKKYDRCLRTSRHKLNQPKETSIKRDHDYLPITLNPSDPETFKQIFLRLREAKIIITYSNGRVEQKYWHAKTFSSNSDVLRNLRSRHEFRSGVWQKSGIAKVHVKTGDEI